MSDLTDLIVVANAGNSSFVVQTDSVPALYVDSNANVGIHTLTPSAQLEVVSNTGECVRVRHAKNGPSVDIGVSSDGDLELNVNTVGRSVKTEASLDIVNHDGNTVGLKLNGSLVEASAAQLNSVVVSAGVASAGKAMILDSSKNISGVSSITASQLGGTLQTAAQPNITSVGTLSSLNVTNGVTASQLTGTLQTAAQPNITSVGTLSSLNVTNGVTASQLTGTLQTAAQPNITSVGNLESLTVAGVTIGNEATYLSGVVAGVASPSQAVVLDDEASIIGIDSITADKLTGTLQTASQPNITSVGTLNSLNVSNGVTASQLTGTLQTAAQPNITSIGNLSSVSIAGSTVSSEAAFIAGAVAGTAAGNKAVVLNSSKSVSGITSLSATNISGTIQTAAQPNITSIGNLSSVTVAGSTIGNEASYLSGSTAGVATPNKAVVLNSSKSVSGLTSLSATNLTGTIQTAAQPNVTSVGNLSSLNVDGVVSVASTNDSSSVSTGAVTVSGGVGISKNLYVGSNIYGVVATAAQPNITSVGSLNGLNVVGDVDVVGTLTLNGTVFGQGGGSAVEVPAYVTGITAGTASASKALVLNSAKSISGITTLSASNLNGTIQTSSQPNITSLGNLSSVTIAGSQISNEAAYLSNVTPGTASNSKVLVLNSSGSISGIDSLSATNLSGTLQTASQPNVTSLGTLSSLSVGGNVDITGALTVNGSTVGGTPDSLSGVTAGTAYASKALVLDSSKNISGIGLMSMSDIIVAGTAQSLGGVNWTNGSTSTTNNFNSVCWAPELSIFVAVADNAVMTSTNGVDWISRTPASNRNWQSVCWAADIATFAAVANSGTGNRAMISSDGISWTSVSTPADSNWVSVCWSSELASFAAVAYSSSDCIMTSAGGNSWAIRSSGSTGSNFKSVTWSSSLGRYIAVGDSVISTASNIVGWGTVSVPITSNWSSVCWSPDLSIAVAISSVSGAGSKVVTSSNGGSWIARTITQSNGSWNSVVWSSELSLFVAVSSAGTGNRIMTSPDGITWTSRTNTTDKDWKSICWSSDQSKFVAVGSDGACMTSSHVCNTSISFMQSDVSTKISADANLNYYSGRGSHNWFSNNQEIMRATKNGVGIGSALPERKLDISSSTGKCLRLRYGSGQSVDIDVTSSRALKINSIINSTNGYQLNGNFINVSSLVNNYGGTGTASMALILDGSGNISGINSLSATQLTGTLQTASQPNITSVGTLGSLTVTNGVTASQLTGTLQTAAQPNITSVGTLSSLTVTNRVTASQLTGTLQTAAQPNITSVGTLGSLSVTNGVTASQLTGTLQTAAQPNITSVGTLGSLSVGGNVNITGTLTVNGTAITSGGSGGSSSDFLTGVTAGTAAASKALVLDSSKNISGINKLSSTDLVMDGSAQTIGGINWSHYALSDSTGWGKVIYSPELSIFVATAYVSTNSIMTSPDGITWTIRSSPIDHKFGALCWCPELSIFVAAGSSGTSSSSVITSPDGIVWTARTSPIVIWQEICWSPELSLFVGVAYSGTTRIYVSTNGMTWNSVTVPNGTSKTITWVPELSLFIAAGDDIITSPNGTTWTSRTKTSSGTITSLAWSKDLNKLVGISNVSRDVIISSDGINWSHNTIASFSGNYRNTVCWSPQLSLFVTAAYNGSDTISISSDGTNWTSLPVTQYYYAMCWAQELSKFVAVGPGYAGISSHVGYSKVNLIKNVAQSGFTNTSSIGLSASTSLNYSGGLNGSHRWTYDTPQVLNNEIMRLTQTGLGIGVSSPKVKLDIKSSSGKCMRLRYGTNSSVDIDVTSTGTLSVNNTINATAFSMNGTIVNLSTLSGVTAGTAAASKALVLDASRNITNINSLTTSTLVLGSTSLTSTEGAYLTSITAGTAAASKALVLDASRNITNINSLTTSTLILGSTSLTSTEGAYLTSITAGTATASKAIVLDASRNITNINTLTATNAVNANLINSDIISASNASFRGNWNVGYWGIGQHNPNTIRLGACGSTGAWTGGLINLKVGWVYCDRIGVGTDYPTAPIEVNGAGVYTVSPSWMYPVNGQTYQLSSGTVSVSALFSSIIAATDFLATSDRRLKTEITHLDSQLCRQFIDKTSPVMYKFKNNLSRRQYGYIAQDLFKAGFTDLISVVPQDGLEETIDEDGFKSVANEKMVLSYEGIIPILATNIKNIYQENDQLKQENETLKQQIADILQRLSNLESSL